MPNLVYDNADVDVTAARTARSARFGAASVSWREDAGAVEAVRENYRPHVAPSTRPVDTACRHCPSTLPVDTARRHCP